RVQDLVGVRVADSREKSGVGQGALDRVILARQSFPKRGEIRRQHLQASALELGQRRLPANDVQRSLFFELASVKRRVPPSNSNAASAVLPAGRVPRGRQWRRPAIIR